MLKYRLLHPELLSVLAQAGHGSRILLADANYPVATGAVNTPQTAVVIATGEDQLYANLLLTIGVVRPGGA